MKLPNFLTLDKVIEKIVALGVPGLVLVIVIAAVGPAGGAAIVAALAALGGPFGMMGGIALLGLLVLISRAIAEYGVKVVANRVIDGLIKQRMAKEEIIKSKEDTIKKIKEGIKLEIDGYWFLSDNLKKKLKDMVGDYQEDDEDGATVPSA